MTKSNSVFTSLKIYKFPLLIALGVLVLYGAFAYDLVRSDFMKLITLVGALFFLTYQLIKHFGFNFWILAGLGVLFRLVFLPAIPNLSQDFYRFLWDGRLLAQGVNPYLFTPEQLANGASNALSLTTLSSVTQYAQLIEGMGALNASHYSNYPPINQLFFVLAALLGGKSILGSVIVLRLFLIAADIGILYFGKKLLEVMKLPVNNIFWYFLNPFILIELSGNLHFEGVMLFFVVWSLYHLVKGKWLWAAVLLGVSVSVKLLPLLFLPLFLRWFYKIKERKDSSNNTRNLNTDPSFQFFSLGMTKLILFYMVTIATVLFTFAPFLSSEFIQNFSATIGLWFQKFEFNASVYYIIRWIGFQTVGWNIIETVGKILPLITLAIILALSFFRKNNTPQRLITALLFSVSVYFLFSTTVHPWYIATPLLLSVFTNYRFPIIWSAAVMLSYSAYGKEGFDENLWLIAAQYIVVIAFAITEILARKGSKEGNFRIVEH